MRIEALFGHPSPGTRMPNPRIIAHRGASGHDYQNSPAAFCRAVALNADGIELDVHGTADGVLVVHHDSVLPGLGPIATLPAERVLGYLLPNGEALPSLAAALELIGALDVWIEVKALDPAHDVKLLRVLDEGPAPTRYAVHSFDHRLISRLGGRRPSLVRGALLASYSLDPLALLDSLGAAVLWQQWDLIDDGLVDRLHREGRRIVAWTVDEPVEIRRLAALGVDGICANLPDQARAALTGP